MGRRSSTTDDRTSSTTPAAEICATPTDNGSFWAFETLDGNGGPNGRTTNSVAWTTSVVLYGGRPHVFYHDDDDLRHALPQRLLLGLRDARRAGRTAGLVNGGPGLLQFLDCLQRPTTRLLRRARRAGPTWVLRHAYWNGIAWAFETLDGLGGRPGHTNNDVGRPSAAMVYNGRPHVFYYDETDGDLRHAYYNGVAWAFEVLDGAGGGGGRTNHYVGEGTTVLLYNNRPHVFYYDDTDGSLRHAYYNGVAWAFETLDGNGSVRPGHTTNDVGDESSAVVYNGRPHVFYYDDTDASLRHAYYNGVAWAFETLDGSGSARPGHTTNSVGRYNAVLIYKNRPHVFYQDSSDISLRHAYYNGVAWAFETLDGTASTLPGHTTQRVGYDIAIALYGGKPQVLHGGASPDTLRRAYWTGSAWSSRRSTASRAPRLDDRRRGIREPPSSSSVGTSTCSTSKPQGRTLCATPWFGWS
ncbi:MAG: hypothetical protein M5U31_16370 [Acidimicrobiia bacterium]|nr:hypothetical protein [Acidimicrobiia bacterium]